MATVRYVGTSPIEIPSLGIQIQPGAEADVPAELARELRARPDFTGPSGDEFDDLDRDGLLAFADEHGLEVNRRLGDEKLRAQVRSLHTTTTED